MSAIKQTFVFTVLLLFCVGWGFYLGTRYEKNRIRKHFEEVRLILC